MAKQAPLATSKEAQDFRALKDGRSLDHLSFGQAFNAAKAEGRLDFPWRGTTYSTKTAEEQGREIKAAAGSGRGAYAGRAAEDVSTAPMRREGSADPVARTDEVSKPRMTASDIPGLIARGMMEGADRAPAGRGLGAMFVGGAGGGTRAAKAIDAARAARAAKTAKRAEPKMDLEPVAQPFRSARAKAERESARRAGREAEEDYVRDVMERGAEMGMKHGGKVKTYAKGSSVRGAGCETRHKKTRFV